MDWAAHISEICIHRQWKVEALAAELQVRPSTVYRWVSGETEPSLLQQIKLRERLAPPNDAFLRGLISNVDVSDSLVTLMDAKFSLIRASKRHRAMSPMDVTELYGRPGERYWSEGMAAIIEALGGLKGYRERGITRLDLRLEVVREPGQPGYSPNKRLFTVGHTITQGCPHKPLAYYTQLTIEEGGEPSPPRIWTEHDKDPELINSVE